MIPKFTEDGLLPEGIHECSLEEFKERFANNPIRLSLYEKIIELIGHLKRIECPAIYIDGSYVTSKRLPNDFDACWDNKEVDIPLAKMKVPLLFNMHATRVVFNGDIFPAYALELGGRQYFIDFFQYDKVSGKRKGIIKISI